MEKKMKTDFKIFLGLLSVLTLLLTLGCGGTLSPIKEPSYPPPIEEPRPSGKTAPAPAQDEKELSPDRALSVYVVTDHLNLRACAGLNCRVISVLQRGEELDSIAEKGEWMKVKVKSSDKEGWVFSKFVSSERPKAAPRSSKPAASSPKLEEEWASSEKGTDPLPLPKEDFAR